MASLLQRYISVRRRDILLATKNAITDMDTVGAAAAIHLGGPYLAGRSAAKRVAEIVTGRMSDQLSHESASDAWRKLCHSLPESTSPQIWFMLESLAQAVGCFDASADCGEKGVEGLSRSRTPRDRFIGAIQARDVDAATEALPSLPRGEPSRADAAHYLWLWSGGVEGEPQWSTDSDWLTLVGGASVTIVGPAPAAEGVSPVPPGSLVARVIAPGVTQWPTSDVSEGRCDLAYANSKSTKWFIREGAVADLEKFRYLSYRTSSGDALGLAHSRVAFHHKALLPMPWDRTNMVPVAAWDLLHVPDAQVAIVASNFFASRTAYTANDVRFDAERNQATDQSGSTGIVFERCVSFSFHNIGAHLNVMANLAQAGSVSFDAEGSAVLAMTYRDYLKEIDELYGVAKI